MEVNKLRHLRDVKIKVVNRELKEQDIVETRARKERVRMLALQQVA